jgi:outer membrane protein assembly factor BamB
VHEHRLLLEVSGQPRVALLPLDQLALRTFDRRTIVTLKPGSLPPVEVRLRTVGRSFEVFARTGDIRAPARATQVSPAPSSAPVAAAASGRAPSAPPGASKLHVREWASFRGPGGEGVADGAHPPTTWDAEKGVNVRWKTPIPGLGHSSPVVWGNRVFLTTTVSANEAATIFRHGAGASSTADSMNRSLKDEGPHSWRVYALDRDTGKVVWQRVSHEGVPRTPRHVMASQADPTPVTDGRHVIAFFGSEGLYCYDIDGRLVWKRDIGPMTSGYVTDPTYEWTVAASPILYKGMVLLQVDLLEGSYIAAFDVKTGKTVWRTERDEVPSWSTPYIFEGPPRTELVTVAPTYARGYDPDTGKELWRLGRHATYPTPAPIGGLGMIFITSGSGTTVQPIYAIRPGATGDITLGEDEGSNEAVVWSKERGGSFIPTPVFYDDILYVCNESGILTAYRADTGGRLYQERLTRGGSYSASAVAADGHLYFTSEDGEVIVVRAGPKFEKVSVNPMGEVVMATPAIAPGMLLFRTLRHVVAITDARIAK